MYSQHARNLELQVKIRPKVEVRNREDVVVAALLESDAVLPVQYAEGEVLL